MPVEYVRAEYVILIGVVVAIGLDFLHALVEVRLFNSSWYHADAFLAGFYSNAFGAWLVKSEHKNYGENGASGRALQLLQIIWQNQDTYLEFEKACEAVDKLEILLKTKGALISAERLGELAEMRDPYLREHHEVDEGTARTSPAMSKEAQNVRKMATQELVGRGLVRFKPKPYTSGIEELVSGGWYAPAEIRLAWRRHYLRLAVSLLFVLSQLATIIGVVWYVVYLFFM